MRVLIGAQICNVTSLSANQLTCKPPESQPAALINGKEDYDELPEVVVLIGDSLQYKIGKLSYSTGNLFEAITQGYRYPNWVGSQDFRKKQHIRRNTGPQYDKIYDANSISALF